MVLRVAFVAEGDANTRHCWSGCAQGFIQALRRRGVSVDVVDVELRSWRRWLSAARSFDLRRSRWRRRFRLGRTSFDLRSGLAGTALRKAGDYDAVVQAGATFLPEKGTLGSAPLVVYADANVLFARRGAPFAGASALSPTEAADTARRERLVYEAAERIWTWSDALKESFEQDFAQPRDKLLTIYAGANLVLPARDPRWGQPSTPRILFVGKDHVRKGSAVLLDAFTRVHERIPDAELHFVGGTPRNAERPGVIAHGFIPPDTLAGARRLQNLYAQASVFCLPSFYEPFGVAFAEAMLAGLPCIGTDDWAMREIIVPGETGWLVPAGDASTLAETLTATLLNPERAARMGAAARERALERFTWDRVAARAIDDLQGLLAR